MPRHGVVLSHGLPTTAVEAHSTSKLLHMCALLKNECKRRRNTRPLFSGICSTSVCSLCNVVVLDVVLGWVAGFGA